MLSTRVRVWLSCIAFAQFALLFGLALARYQAVHQRTFDLALYARLAWGFAHLDFSTPILDKAPLGTHWSPILLPLGLLGRLSSTVYVLLLAQAACVSLCIFPIARVGARHMGHRGLFVAVAAWLLYPNLGHVAAYEFHPGTLAVLPTCWAFDALERGHLRHLRYACLGLLACREDLFVMAALFALLYAVRFRKRQGVQLAAALAVYGALALAMVITYAPDNSSLDQHFSVWGGSPFGIVRALFTDPWLVVAHLRAPEKLWYLPRLLAALSFFPLRSVRLLIPGLPYLALNLASTFPTSTEQYSHYLTPAVPALVVAGVVGVASVRKPAILAFWLLTLALASYALGGLPWSRDFPKDAFRSTADSRAAWSVLSRIPASGSVAAPDALLPHLAERRWLHRAPPPLHDATHIVLDVSHRERYAHRESLLRTSEEPFVRATLARSDFALEVYAPPYALLRRGASARSGAALQRYFHPSPSTYRTSSGISLTPCLSVLDAILESKTIHIVLRAHSACRADLALRIAPNGQHGRADLLFDGALSPALLAKGDVLVSAHPLRSALLRAAKAGQVWLGSVRADGKTAESGDPLAVPVAVHQAQTP